MATPLEIDRRRGLTEAVRRAASAPGLRQWDVDATVSTSLAAEAFDLMIAIGRCQLFGVGAHLELVEFLLEPEMVDFAIQVGVQRIEQVRARLEVLELDLARCDSELEADDWVIGILHERVVLAALVSAVNRMMGQLTGDDYHDVATVAPSLVVAHENLRFRLADLDRAIEDHRDELACASRTYWIDNLVADLAADQWSDRPWWMTGEIHVVDQANHQVAQQIASADELVESFGVIGYAVQIARDVRDFAVTDESVALAADDSSVETRFSCEMSLDDDKLKISFRLPATQVLKPTDQIDDQIEVEVGCSADVAVRDCVANDDGVVQRVYRLRWGTTGLRVMVRKRWSDQSSRISLVGRTKIPFAMIRALDEAEGQRRVYIRREDG